MTLVMDGLQDYSKLMHYNYDSDSERYYHTKCHRNLGKDAFRNLSMDVFRNIA